MVKNYQRIDTEMVVFDSEIINDDSLDHDQPSI